MSDCRQTAERLTPYVDALLPSDERATVDAHLRCCVSCRRLADLERGSREVMQSRANRLREPSLPPGLHSRCAAMAEAHRRSSSRTPWFSWFVPAVVSAALILLTVGAIMMLATQRSSTVLATQLTADHSKCFHLFAPTTPADARETPTALFTDYGVDVHVPPSSTSDGVRLLGARRCLYADGRMPHLMYEVDGHETSLFVLDGDGRAAADVDVFGHRARIWSRGDTTFVLVSPRAAGEMTRAVAYLRREAE